MTKQMANMKLNKSTVAPRSRRTFDNAQDQFRFSCTWRNAHEYMNAALEYWFDDMIGDETLLAALHEIRKDDRFLHTPQKPTEK